MSYFLAYFHGVFIFLQIHEPHVPVSSKWIAVLLPLFLRTRQVVERRSRRSSMIGETKEAGATSKSQEVSHTAFKKRIETIIATILIPHPDELNYAAKGHETHDLIHPALPTSRVHLDLVLLGSFSDADFAWTVATCHSTIALYFRHAKKLVLVCLLVVGSIAANRFVCFGFFMSCKCHGALAAKQRCHYSSYASVFTSMRTVCSLTALRLLGTSRRAVPIRV